MGKPLDGALFLKGIFTCMSFLKEKIKTAG